MIHKDQNIGLRVKCLFFLSDFNQNWNVLATDIKIPQRQIWWKSIWSSQVVMLHNWTQASWAQVVMFLACVQELPGILTILTEVFRGFLSSLYDSTLN
jgi:hypothetical protein